MAARSASAWSYAYDLLGGLIGSHHSDDISTRRSTFVHAGLLSNSKVPSTDAFWLWMVWFSPGHEYIIGDAVFGYSLSVIEEEAIRRYL